MISNKLIQSMVFNDCLSSRPVIDVPVDAGDDEVGVTVSAKTFRIDTRVGLVIFGLAGGVIVVFAAIVIGGLVNGMIGVGVDMLTELGFIDTRVTLEDSLGFCC